MVNEPPRSRTARLAAEQALVRVARHYGTTPEFVLLGGLVPELLCSGSGMLHAGTTDVDVQVDLEIAAGAVNMIRLEQALANAEFEVDPNQVWRWQTEADGHRAVVKFELLADLDEQPAGAIVNFDACEALGAVNLRGTGFAAYGRRKEKDWYDIAFVLLHNDFGGPEEAVRVTLYGFRPDLVGGTRSALDDLLANFAALDAQGPVAYASQVIIDHPESDGAQLWADAVVAVRSFCSGLFSR